MAKQLNAELFIRAEGRPSMIYLCDILIMQKRKKLLKKIAA